MDGLTQTQERKLWASILNGNDHSIKWHKVFSSFSTLGIDRQMTALKHIPVKDFLEIRNLFDAASKVRCKDIEAHLLHLEGVSKIKKMMSDSGVSLDDISGVRSKPVKRGYSAVTKKVDVEEFFSRVSAMSVNGILAKNAPSLAKDLGIGMSTVYLRLSTLIDDGRLVNLGKDGYQIIQK